MNISVKVDSSAYNGIFEMFKSSLEDGAKDNNNLYTSFSSFALKLLTRKKKTDSVRKGFGPARAAANIECDIKLNKALK